MSHSNANNGCINLSPSHPFMFPPIETTSEWFFERLGINNFNQLYLLFNSDENKFVDERFKTSEGARKYAMINSGEDSCNNGADWLFSTNNGEYAGILHLYNLSRETISENNKRAWIGFATKASFRGQKNHILS